MLTKPTTTRSARDQYEGDAQTPHSTPLDVALAQVAKLDLNPNPLGGIEWAQKILRQDIARIVRDLATTTATSLRETIAAQNAAIDRLQARIEAGALVALVLAQVQWSAKRGGAMTCPSCFNTEQAGHTSECPINAALATWETSRKEKTV